MCDLEKIASVDDDKSVESSFVTLKKRAGTDIPTASCQVGNILPALHDSVIYAHEGHLRGQIEVGQSDVLFYFSAFP